MKRRIENLRNWYRDPQREILRREVQWALNWLRRPAGLLCGFIYIAISVAMVLLGGVDPTKVSGGFFRGYTYLLAAAASLLVYAIWILLIQKRTLAPLRKERFRDLFLTRVTRRDLWPGLLAAPLVVYAVLGLISAVISSVMGQIIGNKSVESAFTPLMSSTNEFLVAEYIKMFYWIVPLLAWVYGMVFMAALTAYVVRRTWNDGTIFRIVLHAIIGFILLSLPSYLVSFAVIVVPLIISITKSVSAGSPPATPSFLTFGFAFAVIIPTVTLFTSLIMYRLSIRYLLSDKTWEKMRAGAEKS